MESDNEESYDASREDIQFKEDRRTTTSAGGDPVSGVRRRHRAGSATAEGATNAGCHDHGSFSRAATITLICREYPTRKPLDAARPLPPSSGFSCGALRGAHGRLCACRMGRLESDDEERDGDSSEDIQEARTTRSMVT